MATPLEDGASITNPAAGNGINIDGNDEHVRVTWDFTVGNNEQSVRVYFDDVEPPYISDEFAIYDQALAP